ncbi:unnamed protein product [Camellia sinensis]
MVQRRIHRSLSPPMGLWEALLNWLRSLFFKQEMELSLIGLQNAGKTSLVNVVATGGYSEDMIPTVGFNMKKVTKGNVTIKLWDLGGQPRFRSMWERYCRAVSAIVFATISDWVERWWKHSGKVDAEALLRRRWTVEGCDLLLEWWSPLALCTPEKTSRPEKSVWIRLMGLPIHLRGEVVFRFIGDHCGGFIEADESYVVDAADHDNLSISRSELHDLLSKPSLSGIPLLVLGNKIDKPGALSKEALTEQMGLQSITDREVCCYMISCKNSTNIDSVIDWLIKHSKSKS